MIGQKELLKNIDELIRKKSFPRFSILIGNKGSGKKLICDHIADKLGLQKVYIGKKTEEIRQMIKNAYKVVTPTLYIIADADDMVSNAKNAILKVTEEPPNNAYFIITLQDINNTLDTIKSRGTVFSMDRYTPKQIIDYTETLNNSLTDKEKKIIKQLCVVPGDVQILLADNVTEFYDYAEKVVDHIAKVSSANCFKIADKVALKEDSNGYDLKLFWKAFINICLNKIHEEPILYANGISITSDYLQMLRVKASNKQMLMDMWIMSIRKAWIS